MQFVHMSLPSVERLDLKWEQLQESCGVSLHFLISDRRGEENFVGSMDMTHPQF